MAVAHLIFGFIGSGKTTLAKALESQHNALRLTPDEWMARLFGEDPPAAVFEEKAAAVMGLLEPIWMRCLNLELDVILDYGFWSRAERDRVRLLVQSCGATPVFYSVECTEDEARNRILERNLDPHRSLYIAPETFDLLKFRFEPLQADEAWVPGDLKDR